MSGEPTDRERALIATGEELAVLLHHPSANVLLALLDNPALDETHVCLLLERKNLPGEILEEVARRKLLLKSYRVKRSLAFHPRTPRLVRAMAEDATRAAPATRKSPSKLHCASAPAMP